MISNGDVVAGEIAVAGQVVAVGVADAGDSQRRQDQRNKNGAGEKAFEHGSLQCPARARKRGPDDFSIGLRACDCPSHVPLTPCHFGVR
jgi:hypothetical protein